MYIYLYRVTRNEESCTKRAYCCTHSFTSRRVCSYRSLQFSTLITIPIWCWQVKVKCIFHCRDTSLVPLECFPQMSTHYPCYAMYYKSLNVMFKWAYIKAIQKNHNHICLICFVEKYSFIYMGLKTKDSLTHIYITRILSFNNFKISIAYFVYLLRINTEHK